MYRDPLAGPINSMTRLTVVISSLSSLWRPQLHFGVCKEVGIVLPKKISGEADIWRTASR